MNERNTKVLTQEQIKEFLDQGVLVADNIFDFQEIQDAADGLSETLAKNGVDVTDIEGTGHNLSLLSSTNGSGGVVDLFYDDWKMAITSNPRLFQATTELWNQAYCSKGEARGDLLKEESFKWHQHGAFDCNKGYMYIDRIGFRLPTALSDKLGAKLKSENGRRKGRKTNSLQRSLTPHLDCCPIDFFSDRNMKWRPIQCFISLTTNLDPNTGGFEALPGFHLDFENWIGNRVPTVYSKKINGVVKEVISPPPCIGEYTHIRPKEDASIMEKIRHIPVRTGSVVFWDNRIPHGNAYRHDGNIPRAVVYCSFLPDVPVNRKYVQNQLDKYKKGKSPSDQWTKRPNDDDVVNTGEIRNNSTSNDLVRKLLGIENWDSKFF
mmetsp:Transcript_8387/g.12924  ORF Transcript_8387/g.12924 Transcript_8387/m.12924 type:complete len:378 (-) Transcript_8387:329-1462(-)|eukprot:CAMPEP_0178915442 /NCGR_PEP_ID=MMETSP0786-20121207/12030_1 /TAXON_ID=186022 /ORGANISM="Thalassionema frauenfeldii, Strain CCMP 1798" /LENGTH=377 /DNA_ID=CAMNT_0020588555 /DNA_START=111 /DNA_END=1247 /DNA_ORIENTATION=-